MPSPLDAVPLTSTPADLPALPSGTFAISLDKSISNTNSCLSNDQSCAWDCATGADLSMVVTIADSNAPKISLSYPTLSDEYIHYGSQPPQLNRPANMVLMKDKDDFNKGPAYWFQQQYDKLVIVHEGDLQGPIPSPRRSFLKRWFYDNGLKNHGSLKGRQDGDSWASNILARPGERPWFCYWNNTVLEGFIFVTQDANLSASASDASPSAAATSSGSSEWSRSRSKRQSAATSLFYPKSVKIEERRPLKPSQPYCQQLQILDTHRPGSSILQTLYLNETGSQSLVQNQAMQGMGGIHISPEPAASPSGSSEKRGVMHKRTTYPSACQCKWVND